MNSQITINDLKKMVGFGDNFGQQIYCHPDNLRLLEKTMDTEKSTNPYLHNPLGPLYGIEIFADPNLPKFRKKWVIPNERYCTFGPEDEVWARPLGFGHEEDDPDSPVFFMINKPRRPIYTFDPTSPKYVNKSYFKDYFISTLS